MKIKIYEIKSGAAVNAPGLLSPDKKYFYWDTAQFTNNNPGDKVFVINPTHKWALFTEIKRMDIAATFNAAAKKSTFNHEYNSYAVEDPDGRYKVFIRFDIIQRVDIPADWKWHTTLGSSQIYDLWRDDIELDNRIKRKEKVNDLMKLFPDGAASQTLSETMELLSGPMALNQDIVDAVHEESLKDAYKDIEFYFLKAQQKLNEFDNYVEPVPGFFADALEKFSTSGKTFSNFLAAQIPGDPLYLLFRTIGELVSYCEKNAANKNELNEYDDKRTLAKVVVTQNDWAKGLLKYKIEHNNLNALNSIIYNAVQYLKDPEHNISMLSEKHRALVSKNLLKQSEYNKETFVQDLSAFFNPYMITPANPMNLTRVISHVLYRYEKVKRLWFERIEGLVACDNTDWMDGAVADCKSIGKIALWWSVMPTKKSSVDKLLPATIKDRGFFYLFYVQKNLAVYRARVMDYAYNENYAAKKWNSDGDVTWYKNNFSEYRDTDGKTARIVFLADEFIKLETPVPIDSFEFYSDAKPPRRDNLQPYSEIDWEEEVHEPSNVPAPNPDPEPIPVVLLPATHNISFDEEDRDILTAIKTKPFILLAGLSGTGKSRLVRKLAFKTCALEELQVDKNKPGNFELIPVRPNWHDSSELMGYVTRISGKPEYVSTDFLRFLVKAWNYPDIPFFLCLDEMNQATVEQYFAEYLSIVETRDNKDGQVVSDALLSARQTDNSDVYNQLLINLGVIKGSLLWNQFVKTGLTIPPNLIVMGTVNMDETTHSFSRKVLDRAMTIEMNKVNLREGLDEKNIAWTFPAEYLSHEIILGQYTSGGQVYKLLSDNSTKILDFLELINGKLDKTPFKIAYRVRDEFLVYCYHNSLLLDKPEEWLNTCLDEMTFMKVLSRIEGDESRTKDVLNELKKILESTFPAECTKSLHKVSEMITRLDISGYTSFWS